MNALEMFVLVGRHVFLEPARGLRIRCRVTNAKTSYGRNRLEIEPITGEGRAWVDASSVAPCSEPAAETVAANVATAKRKGGDARVNR
jgi:hypothetical protein